MSDPAAPGAAPGLVFPCTYPLKLIGRRTPDFAGRMMAIITQRPERVSGAPAERVSRDGNYVSLAITVQVESRAELDTLFRELHSTGLVLFAL